MLKNLKLKRHAVNRLFPIAVSIKEGFVGRIELVVPWSALSSKPTIVRISDVFLVVNPAARSGSSVADVDDDAAQAQLAKKRERLAALDAEEAAKRKSGAGGGSSDGNNAKNDESFVQRTVTTVISNLQVFVDTVHVRFEDALSPQPFAFGVTVDSFEAQACDADGRPVAANVTADIIHKLVSLRHFAVYWNSGQRPLQFATLDELAALLKAALPNDKRQVDSHQYLLKVRSKKSSFRLCFLVL